MRRTYLDEFRQRGVIQFLAANVIDDTARFRILSTHLWKAYGVEN